MAGWRAMAPLGAPPNHDTATYRGPSDNGRWWQFASADDGNPVNGFSQAPTR